MVRKIIEVALFLMIVGYIVHNPVGTAHVLRSWATGAGDFLAALIG